MLFSTTEQFIVLCIVLAAGFLLGFASRPSARKWKNKVRALSDNFTAYHSEAEDRVRAAKQRATALEAEAAALRADHAEAERTIATLKGAAGAAPVALVDKHDPVEHPVMVQSAPAKDDDGPHAAPVATGDDRVVEHAEPVAAVPEARARDAVVAPVALSAARPAFGVDPQPAREAEPSEPAATRDAPLADFPMTPTPSDAAPAAIGPAAPEMPAKGWFGSSRRDDLRRIRGIDSALNTRLFGLGVLRFEDLEKLSAEDEMALEQRIALPAGYVAREQWRAQAALLRAGNDREHIERFGAATAEI